MDLKTSYAFYFVSLAIYVIVLTAMALADKRVIGTRWLAYSVLIDLVKTALQAMAGQVPRWLSTMVANELVIVTFFTMYMGLRWFMQREPLQKRTGTIAMLAVMAVYVGMFQLHIRYAFDLLAAVILVLSALSLNVLWRQREERFRLPAGITSGLILIHMGLIAYRASLAFEVYQRGDWRPPVNDPRWNYSMLGIVLLSNCLLIMWVWFAAAEMYSAVEATAGLDALTGCLNRARPDEAGGA